MTLLVLVFGVLVMYMTALYVLSMVLKNNGVADIGYGVACMLVVGTALYLAPPTTVWGIVLGTLPFLWGTRLALRIFRKNYGKPEDFRYKAWREAWGTTFWWRSYVQVYLLQGTVIFIVALPVVTTVLYPSATPQVWLATLGLIVWIVGFFFEVVGDAQLDRFIGNPENKGKIMMSGLWKYSRHPNYFGESTMWIGVALMSAGLSAYPLVGFLSPVLITYLLLFVSGVPLLERRWEGNREWEEYKARTSVFVPLPPRRHGD